MPIIKNEKPDSDVEEVSVSPDKKKSKMQKGAHLLNSRSVRISGQNLLFLNLKVTQVYLGQQHAKAQRKRSRSV